MDKQELIEALQELDKRLSSPIDIVIIGGAAMILHFGSSRATRDIDVLVSIIHHVSRFRPDWAQKIQYYLEEQGWKIE